MSGSSDSLDTEGRVRDNLIHDLSRDVDNGGLGPLEAAGLLCRVHPTSQRGRTSRPLRTEVQRYLDRFLDQTGV